MALILAGGAGGRLDVLTERRAKPATPFAGTYRLIDFSLSNCMHSNIADVWVVEQYEPHSLNDHLANGRPWDLDRTYGGLQVLQPYVGRGGEDDADGGGGFAQGNADALYRNKKFIQEFNPEVLIVLSADHVYKLDYGRVVAAHLEREADVTVVTTRVALEEAKRFGTIKVDRAGRITEFEYKPERPKSNIVAAEVFVYDARKLLDTLDALVEQKRRRGADGEKDGDGDDETLLRDYGHELLPHMVGEGRAYEYRLEGYWRDLGTIESYWQGHMDLLARAEEFALDDARWPILTYGSQRMPARFEGAARVRDSLISPGCVVRGTVISSVLSPGVVVEAGAVVRNSVLLHDVAVRAKARIDCAVVDQGATIGEAARVGGRWRGRAAKIKAENIALLGAHTRVTKGARVKAGARRKPPAPDRRKP